ncbi:OPT oligopeptide transporter protein-domain-containing protein [Lipomyces tetrasporus]|uniref:OPT oligopeptide transporter protein-domain-containing protein n=1 Tax=Lipomyces tetrasporus TaxID=54092 RepID=A0AAD7QXH8_9ASCO|nr:OPT oligopeptide transporter protein-domain-containing protein [Lipomyces tetrasporus]KAJ8103185.1 OPT oligopeptide transporter protein-domain-containing protein [Lipomyces tetrasporus]
MSSVDPEPLASTSPSPQQELAEARLEKINLPQATPRAVAVGLAIGSIVLFSNFQFGLQTGWISMMSLPSALLAFAAFKTVNNYLTYPFTDVENVFVQSVAVAVGTGPLGFGLVGIVPALEKFLAPEEGGPISLSSLQILIWSAGIAFFGVFFAIPLRKQVVVKEKLRFPSGSATATMISVLHEKPDVTAAATELIDQPSTPVENIEETDVNKQDMGAYGRNVHNLLVSFNISVAYTIAAYFIPFLRNLPIFGTSLANNWLWTFQPSPAYIGQGIIMGLPTVSSMLLGAFLGWGILAPMATKLGWAPGPINDWKTGGQGWILWISLAIMVVDSVISFSVVVGRSLYRSFGNKRVRYLSIPDERTEDTSSGHDSSNARLEEADDDMYEEDIVDEEDDAPPEHLVSQRNTIIGIVSTTLLCIVAIKIVFPIVPLYAIVAAILIAFVLSILGVRALGETDLNPVSGIGKISQLLFAIIVPRSNPAAVLINLIAGGVAEAGAQQAGDLMQDLKTGHVLGASPKAQFYAQVIGTAWSVLLSTVVYRLYNAVYDIPGEVFRIPTAVVWIDCSRLVTGAGLPPNAQYFALLFAIIFGAFSIIKALYGDRKWAVYIPSGVAVGVGIYNSPSFTLARFVGGLAGWYLSSKTGYFHGGSVALVISASGLVLGEGLFSVVTMIMTSLHVPHF